MTYCTLLGEALWDLLDRPADGTFHPRAGGSVLNVAVGLARLGHDVEFIGAFGADVLGERLRAFLRTERVGMRCCPTVDAQTVLAVTTFDDAEPSFAFYGHPAAYRLLARSPQADAIAAGAGVVHTGSIALLAPGPLDAAVSAYRQARGVRTFDPNVRLDLVRDVPAYVRLVEDLAALADLVKLSVADAVALYPSPAAAVERLLARGSRAVVLTAGADGARVFTDGYPLAVPSRVAQPLDTTGAGDAVMVGLISRLLVEGWPASAEDWWYTVDHAMALAAVVCGRPGGATAMPTSAELAAAVGPPVPHGGTTRRP